MKTGIECNYGLGLECKVTLDKDIDAEIYAAEVEEILKAAKPLCVGAKEIFDVYVIAEPPTTEGKYARTVTFGISYDFIDYPELYKDDDGYAEFDTMDEESVADDMIEKVLSSFKERGYKSFECKETCWEYDTQEALLKKLEIQNEPDPDRDRD